MCYKIQQVNILFTAFQWKRYILKQYKDFGITDIQYQLLMKFAKEVKKFILATSRASLPRVFLKSPEWKKIMEMAKEVLKAFNYTDRRKSL